MDINYYKKYEPIDGKWYINKELGSGAFGTVLEIERRDFSQAQSALKVITIPASQSEVQSYCDENFDSDEKSVTSYFYGFVEEFINEFKLMTKLRGNSNIVSIEDYDMKKHEEGIGWDIFIRMELLTPMNKYFASHSLTQNEIIKLGIDICKALEVCQKYKIIHRDIKPSNIFVSDTGEFKLGDFGVARTLEKTSSGLSKKGTSTYMAPEIFKGEEYGSNVDIYSLGIVMYRLLNNNFEPFRKERTHNDEENALVMRLKGESIPAPENADGRLAEIVLKACSFNPKDRYESPMQMRQELESILYNKMDAPVIYPEGDEIEYETTNDSTSNNGTIGIFGGNENNIEKILIEQEFNGVSYKWDNSKMYAADIKSFSLCSGDCPIVNIKFKNNSLILYNKINGSRDGWMQFPEGYFDEKKVLLDENEIKGIYERLNGISFENWITEPYMLKCYIEGATGFCVDEAFHCEFNDGTKYSCLFPKTKEFKSFFEYLTALIKTKTEAKTDVQDDVY